MAGKTKKMSNHNHECESSGLERYAGKIKQLDKDGRGYIICYNDNEKVLLTPSSFSDPARTRTFQEGDGVEFSLMAVDVVPTGPKCYSCGRIGHHATECSQKTNSRVKCHRCGIIGHYARDCFSGRASGSCNSVSSGRSTVFLNRREHASTASGGGDDDDRKRIGSVVCVKDKKDVKRVEEVEDCFILDFDPTQITDDDDDDNGVEEEEEEEEEEDEEEEAYDDKCRVMRSIVCVKKAEQVKRVEEVEDCFILEFDPTEPIKFSYLSLSENSKSVSAEEDMCILAEKGQVACRDYPHPRHICATHPFESTPHEHHCKMCYCYVCDLPAPCKDWTKCIGFQHCDATADTPFHRELRNQKKKEKG